MKHQRLGINGFIDLCLHCKDRKSLETILDVFLTQEEKSDIADRYLIVRELLKQEYSQRDIAKKFDVSIAKITRGSNELKRIKPELLQVLREKIVK